MKESCLAWRSQIVYEGVISHINESCDWVPCAMTHLYVTWLIYTSHDLSVSHMTHPYITWLIYTSHDSSISHMTQPYVPWPIHTWHNPSTCDMAHLLTCGIPHSLYQQMWWHTIHRYKLFGAQITHPRVTWLIYTCCYTQRRTYSFVPYGVALVSRID